MGNHHQQTLGTPLPSLVRMLAHTDSLMALQLGDSVWLLMEIKARNWICLFLSPSFWTEISNISQNRWRNIIFHHNWAHRKKQPRKWERIEELFFGPSYFSYCKMSYGFKGLKNYFLFWDEKCCWTHWYLFLSISSVKGIGFLSQRTGTFNSTLHEILYLQVQKQMDITNRNA